MNQENNALVTQILEAAAEECERIKAQAELYVKETQERADREETEFLATREALAEKEGKEFIQRKETLATLDANKYILGVKQEIVDGIYRRAIGRMNGMSESQYLAFLENLISRYAEEGDKVVFAQNCPVEKEKLSSLPSVKARGLSLSFDGKFSGGIVLSGEKCDKELTFEAVCESVREETEAQLSKTLFGTKQ